MDAKDQPMNTTAPQALAERLPSLRSLRAFQVAGRHMSFKWAAEELCLTASAVSHQVKNLEEFLDIELFERKTRSLEFTSAGRRYFQFLDSMFARLESETHQLRADHGRNIIRLCVPPFFANQALLPRMQVLQAVMPDTDIRISTQTSVVKVHPVEADLSILLGNDEWPELVTHRLFSRRLVVGAAPSLLKGFDASSTRSLDDQTLIVHELRPEAWTHWARAAGVEPPRAKRILRFDSMSSVVQAAAQGLGFAIISWPLCRSWFRSGALKRAFEQVWDTQEGFYLAHRPDEDQRPDIQALIQWLIDEFSEG
jgi:DNA-binding transcriptional LysR family regulator